MKRLQSAAILLFLIIFSFSCQSHDKEEPTTTFILVRHAEKADDGTDDPPLNEVGEERAETLIGHLKETDITAIYSTDYKRTRQTVQQIADAKGLTINTYDPSDDSTLENMLAAETGGTVLISGHSNTTPVLVNKLIGEERYEPFEDTDYDNLFMVMASKMGSGKVLKLTF